MIEEKFTDLDKIDRLSELISYNWKGVAVPEGLDIKINLNCKLDKKGNKIFGEMEVDDEGEVLLITLEGGIIKLPFIILDYYSTNPKIINYGRIMYRIDDNWDKLVGRVVGYSGERDFFVNAYHELERINQ